MLPILVALTLADSPTPYDRLVWPYCDLTHKQITKQVDILQRHLEWLHKCKKEQVWHGRDFNKWIEQTKLLLHCWDRIWYYDWSEEHSLPTLTEEIGSVPGYYFGWRPPLFKAIEYSCWHPGPIPPLQRIRQGRDVPFVPNPLPH